MGTISTTSFDPVVVVPAAPIAARNLPFIRLPSEGKAGAVCCLSGSVREAEKADVQPTTFGIGIGWMIVAFGAMLWRRFRPAGYRPNAGRE